MTREFRALEKIVVADDDLDICDLVQMQLTRLGFNTVTANDGGTALALILSERPSLVILDVMMPVMTGFEVVLAVRAHPELASTKIILFSAKSREGDIDFIKEQGVHYIAKPFSPAALAQKVVALLETGEKSDFGTGQ